MLLAFSFACKPGREREFAALLSDPEAGRAVAKGLGATRNTLFLAGRRMVRILEFPDGATPRTMAQLALENENVHRFLQRLGPIVEDGFDIDVPGSLQAFSQRAVVPLVYDVRPE